MKLFHALFQKKIALSVRTRYVELGLDLVLFADGRAMNAGGCGAAQRESVCVITSARGLPVPKLLPIGEGAERF
jgi:hypothetical protein